MILGPILTPSWGLLGPSWGHLGAILGPSWAILGPSWGHLGPSWGHLGPSWGVLGHLGAILGHLGAILGPSWAILGPSWGHLGASRGHLGAILGPSGAILGPSWGHLGSILGPSWVQGALQQVIYEFPHCSIIPGLAECAKRLNNSVHGALGPCDSHETHQPSMLPKPIPRNFTVCCRSCIGHTSMSTRCMNTYGLSDDHTEHCCSIA